MLVACWSTKGGVGTTVVAAGIVAACAARRPDEVLLADLGGDQPVLHGVPASSMAGIAGWLRAGASVPDDALGRLEEPLGDAASLLSRGPGALEGARSGALAQALAADGRTVVADVGTAVADRVGGALVAGAQRSLLVVRACPLAVPSQVELPHAPDGVIVVRDHRRRLTWQEIAARCGAPVVAELDVDPAVGAAVDAGLLVRPLPRRFTAALGAVA
jgi:hypothetical protein